MPGYSARQRPISAACRGGHRQHADTVKVASRRTRPPASSHTSVARASRMRRAAACNCSAAHAFNQIGDVLPLDVPPAVSLPPRATATGAGATTSAALIHRIGNSRDRRGEWSRQDTTAPASREGPAASRSSLARDPRAHPTGCCCRFRARNLRAGRCHPRAAGAVSRPASSS